MNKLALAFVILASACGGSSSTKPSTPTPVTETAKSLSNLELGEIKLVDLQKNEAVEIHADGSVVIAGKAIAVVGADGTLSRKDTGEAVMSLMADGSLKAKSGQLPPITIAADGSVTLEGETVSIDDKGTLVGGKDASPPMRVEGATTPGLKRTAMFVLLGLMLSAGPSDGSAAAPTTAP